MAYKVIKGIYHVKGYSPDGDSIRFEANDDSNWDFFEWKSTYKKKQRKKQLRIEAIDALETHYDGKSQPRSFAVAALEHLLGLLGISGVEYSLSITRIVEAQDQAPVAIITAGLDVYDRPICFAFSEMGGLEDGDEISAAELPLFDSINYQLARDGLVYPTFYDGMDRQIMAEIRLVVSEARADSRGIWAIDRTGGFTLWNTHTIQQDVIIMPKLFRRFIAFFDRRSQFEAFPDYLKDNKDPVIFFSDGTKSDLGELLAQDGRTYGLTVKPEDIIFRPIG
jgi:endonuclease YncB( thermonuclease family)